MSLPFSSHEAATVESKPDLLHFILLDLVVGAIVELGSPGAGVGQHIFRAGYEVVPGMISRVVGHLPSFGLPSLGGFARQTRVPGYPGVLGNASIRPIYWFCS